MEYRFQLFSLGRIVATPTALSRISNADIQSALWRHAHGYWGDICTTDRQLNEDSLKHGGRLLSAYHASDDTTFWIITEADRSATTVLLPWEY